MSISFKNSGKPQSLLDSSCNLGKLEYNNNPIITYCGAIGYANNLESIIQAAEKLQEMGNPVIFVIAGEGMLKSKLEKLAKVKKLKNVIFLGKINKYEVVELYRKAIACLVLFKRLPILSTNSPNKFFDAISTGKPIITNMGGWIGKLVENYKIGFSLENDNPQAIVETVKKLTSMNRKQLEEMEQNARKLAVEKFNSDDMTDKLEMIFKEATKSSSK